jgi:glycosyltransferase involved in cell wall biosynthesis
VELIDGGFVLVKPRISCFMIVRNALSQGYPFVEAIAQALPVCDEMLIGDGGSTDGTLEVLRRLEQLNPKIKVYIDPWPGKGFAHDLRWATNRLMQKCRGEYILYIQANEVIHEKSWDYLRNIPEIWPVTWTFSLPFWWLVRDLWFGETYRLRMGRNIGILEAEADAFTLGLKKTFMLKEFFKALVNPYYFARIIYRGFHSIYAYKKGSPRYSLPVVLPRPVFRYAVVYPLDYVRKMSGRLEFWKGDPSVASVQRQIRELEALALKEGDQDDVARRILEMMRADIWKSGVPPSLYPDHMLKIPVEEHPKIMRELILDKEHKVYYIREELYKMISEMK